MKNALIGARNVVAVIALASLAGFGVATVAVAATSGAEPRPFQTNKAGQTYGTPTEDQDPDLILARGTNGVIGYVLAADLVGPEMRSPAEVEAWIEEFPQDKPRDIPLYQTDGKTVVGTFTISAAQLVESIPEECAEWPGLGGFGHGPPRPHPGQSVDGVGGRT